jgi:hypothetical protein
MFLTQIPKLKNHLLNLKNFKLIYCLALMCQTHPAITVLESHQVSIEYIPNK